MLQERRVSEASVAGAGLPAERPMARIASVAVPRELKLKCQRRIAQCVEAYRSAGHTWPMPTVSFDLRGKTAGKAFLRQNHVQLNAVLLLENQDAFIADTVGHEVAHLATYSKFGRSAQAHGAQWQAMMRLIGQEPRRCHSFDTSNSAVSKATHRYVCACKEHLLTARSHNKAQRVGYVCRACGQALRLAGQSAPAPRAQPVPVTARVPSSKPPVALRPPTPAMVTYARSLAQRHGLVLSSSTLESFDLTSAFITQAKALPVAAAPDGPTSRQLEYARHVSAKTGRSIPEEALKSRRLLSGWLSQALGTARSP